MTQSPDERLILGASTGGPVLIISGGFSPRRAGFRWLGSCLEDVGMHLGIRMSESGTVTTGVARELVTVLSKNVPAVEGIGARAGLSHQDLQDAAGMVSLASFTSMLEAAAYESGNTTLGLELGKEFRISALGPVSHLVRTARTLGDGLEKFIRFFGSVQTGTQTGLTVANGTARLTYSIADPAIRWRVQDAGLTLAVEYSMLSSLLGPSWMATGVDFEHLVADDLAFYRQHFSCPLRFGRRENALMFPARFLDVSLRDADENLHVRLEAELAQSIRSQATAFDLVQIIEAWVASSLCRSVVTDIEVAASDFGMSTRSFQRKLAAHDVSYFDIRNRVRAHIAKCMLTETRVPITSIALQLGYSETSAFSRGFKIMVGETPAEFRRRETLAA
ncbi:MAG: transcriptional regulator, AraC family [Tardiphaga sp.]|nr:transcriptional regulator, AraC family [Tardiphaga sp.]